MSTAAELQDVAPLAVGTPMPAHRTDWLPVVVAAWDMIWKSPMADEFCAEDIIALGVAMEAMQSFYERPSVKTAKILMGVFQPFGITPLDRRRLGWAFKKPEAPKAVETPASPGKPARDPRDILDGVH